jgi:uncharacterized membrane protein YhiD involved in acid resistance
MKESTAYARIITGCFALSILGYLGIGVAIGLGVGRWAPLGLIVALIGHWLASAATDLYNKAKRKELDEEYVEKTNRTVLND